MRNKIPRPTQTTEFHSIHLSSLQYSQTKNVCYEHKSCDDDDEAEIKEKYYKREREFV